MNTNMSYIIYAQIIDTVGTLIILTCPSLKLQLYKKAMVSCYRMGIKYVYIINQFFFIMPLIDQTSIYNTVDPISLGMFL